MTGISENELGDLAVGRLFYSPHFRITFIIHNVLHNCQGGTTTFFVFFGEVPKVLDWKGFRKFAYFNFNPYWSAYVLRRCCGARNAPQHR